MKFAYDCFEYFDKDKDGNYELVKGDPISVPKIRYVMGYRFKKAYLSSIGLTQAEVESVKEKQRARGHKKKKRKNNNVVNEEEEDDVDVEQSEGGEATVSRKNQKKRKRSTMTDEEVIVNEEEVDEFDNTLDGSFWARGPKRTKRKIRLPTRFSTTE